MHASLTIEDGTRLLPLPTVFPLVHGGALHGAQLGYELEGPPGAPLVVVLGGISAGAHVTATAADPRPGWWQPLVGRGAAVDTARCRVLGIDFLGGCGASTGPHHGTPPGAFPAIDAADQARALALLLDALAPQQAPVLIGASFGGMVGLAFAALFPGRLRAVVALSAPDRSHPRATAWRSVQRRIVRLGLEHGCAHDALALARGLALTTYRAPSELATRFDRPPRIGEPRPRFAVEDWLDARGRAFAARFDPWAYLCLSQALDLHRVDAAAITAAVTLVGVTTDELVPLAQLRALRRRLRRAELAELVELDSPYGHDAFLKEHEALAPVLQRVLRAEVRR